MHLPLCSSCLLIKILSLLAVSHPWDSYSGALLPWLATSRIPTKSLWRETSVVSHPTLVRVFVPDYQSLTIETIVFLKNPIDLGLIELEYKTFLSYDIRSLAPFFQYTELPIFPSFKKSAPDPFLIFMVTPSIHQYDFIILKCDLPNILVFQFFGSLFLYLFLCLLP